MRERDTGARLMEKMTLFSSRGSEVAYGAWIGTVAILGLHTLGDLGPYAWFVPLLFDEFLGRGSRQLAWAVLVLAFAPIWLIAGGLFDLVTRQGLFERPQRKTLRRDD